jgi:hypothetical protein
MPPRRATRRTVPTSPAFSPYTPHSPRNSQAQTDLPQNDGNSNSTEAATTQEEDCLVCTEAFVGVSELQCTHKIHLRCIALSGDARCPVCRVDVSLNIANNPELQELLVQRQQQIQRERQQQQTQEDVQVARDLHRDLHRQDIREVFRRRRVDDTNEEEREEFHAPRIRFITPAGFIHYITPLPETTDGAMDVGDCMLAINQIMMNINQQTRQFEADRRMVNLYTVILKLNEISALTGLNITQLCSIIENTQP